MLTMAITRIVQTALCKHAALQKHSWTAKFENFEFKKLITVIVNVGSSNHFSLKQKSDVMNDEKTVFSSPIYNKILNLLVSDS